MTVDYKLALRKRRSHSIMSSSWPQRRRNHVSGHAIYFQYFPAASASGYDAYTAFRDAEMLRNEIDQCAIRRILDRRYRDTNLDHTIVESRKFRFRSARLNVYFDANGQHVHDILPYLLIIKIAKPIQ